MCNFVVKLEGPIAICWQHSFLKGQDKRKAIEANPIKFCCFRVHSAVSSGSVGEEEEEVYWRLHDVCPLHDITGEKMRACSLWKCKLAFMTLSGSELLCWKGMRQPHYVMKLLMFSALFSDRLLITAMVCVSQKDLEEACSVLHPEWSTWFLDIKLVVRRHSLNCWESTQWFSSFTSPA